MRLFRNKRPPAPPTPVDALCKEALYAADCLTGWTYRYGHEAPKRGPAPIIYDLVRSLRARPAVLEETRPNG